MEINEKLQSYIVNEIIPCYDYFDNAHGRTHINSVIKRSLEIAEFLGGNLDLDIVYATAAYHDIGMLKARHRHAEYSHDFVLADEKLKTFFTPDEIITIAEACEDHSTSSKRVPRSIYGKIVADADKDTNLEISLLRGWDYSICNFPDMSFDEHVDDIHIQIVERFGENGSVKFYTNYPLANEFLAQMRGFAGSKEKFRQKMLELIDEKEI